MEFNTVFVDTDILFKYFAIRPEKMDRFKESGTTNLQELDDVLTLLLEIETKNQIICLSEFSILELICTLKRLNSGPKIPRARNVLYQTAYILPVNEDTVSLAWFLGETYKFHSGDALHASFCILNEISLVWLSDKEFYDSFLEVQSFFQTEGLARLSKYYEEIHKKDEIPGSIRERCKNLRSISIQRIWGIC